MIQQRIENPVASKILAGEFAEGDTINIDVDSNGQTFQIKHSAKTAHKTNTVG